MTRRGKRFATGVVMKRTASKKSSRSDWRQPNQPKIGRMPRCLLGFNKTIFPTVQTDRFVKSGCGLRKTANTRRCSAKVVMSAQRADAPIATALKTTLPADAAAGVFTRKPHVLRVASDEHIFPRNSRRTFALLLEVFALRSLSSTWVSRMGSIIWTPTAKRVV